MEILVNNETKILNKSSLSIETLLETLSITNFEGIAIAVNQEVVSKSSWDSYQINDADNILLITATQGG